MTGAGIRASHGFLGKARDMYRDSGVRQLILGGVMRFDNRHARIFALATMMLMAGGCRPSAPGSSASDSTPTPSASSPSAASTRSDSVVLRTDKSQYRAGEKVTLTFENKSSRSYAFNPCTRTIEREENGAWTALPDAGRMCTMEAWILEPRGTRTGPTELPSPMAAGRYRVVVRMTVETTDGTAATPVIAASDPITVS
jgi:hypothetical protein